MPLLLLLLLLTLMSGLGLPGIYYLQPAAARSRIYYLHLMYPRLPRHQQRERSLFEPFIPFFRSFA